MKEGVREYYFPVVKLAIVLGMEVYAVAQGNAMSGVTARGLLLLTFFIGMVTGFEQIPKRRLFFLLGEWIVLFLLAYLIQRELAVLAVIVLQDTGRQVAAAKDNSPAWYVLSYTSLFWVTEQERFSYFMMISMILIIYIQHEYIIASYREQLKKEVVEEEKLKRNFGESQARLLEIVRKNRFESDKRLLEEKAKLSQKLHDKVGRSMNGSVYQLEACRLLFEQDRQKASGILQAVIENLRSSMDEIRSILRQEKPAQEVLAQLQLQGLCEDCKNNYNIDAGLSISGNQSRISEQIWEIILDNTFEGISNALKYAGCTKIKINITVMNKLVRCTIEDNGSGAAEFKDGMGIAGMRHRVRSIGGVLDFETETGFKINMLLPLTS